MGTQRTTHLAGIVGANIAEARKAAQMTQQELSTALGTSISRVSGWEQGKHLPSKSHQPAVAEVLFGGDVTAMYQTADRKAAA